MKPANLWLACLVAVLLQPVARALTTEGTGALPYESISKRNVFQLRDPVVEPPPAPPPTPPANFNLIGVRENRKSRSAVFSVQPAPQPGKPPAGRETLIVTEGETNGPIHVVRIANVKTGDMDIENSGTSLKINFKTHGEKLPPTAAPMPGMVPGMAGMPMPLPMGAQGVPQPFVAGGARVVNQLPGSPVASGMTQLGGGVTRDMRTGASVQFGGFSGSAGTVPQPQAHPEQPAISRETQILLMEIERERTKDPVARGFMPPLPPTVLTPTPPMPGQ